jgi:2-dehydro-3-deoxyphosphogluconate aldolase / (4S)-4-hydroxy-2-oxoglutarate aldolase
MSNILEVLSSHKVIPVVVLNKSEDALPLAKALIDGGLPVAEVTFRTDAALESIKKIAESYPEIILGAGSVSTIEQVKDAVAAGAKYIVCAGFSKKVVEYCVENDIPIIPGVCTPTEVMMAQECGLNVVKFFPAEQYGGLNTIKAISGPFPKMKFVPTGGISLNNILEYLNSDKILACGGSWMVKGSLVTNGEFDKIKELVADTVKYVNK